MQYKRGSVYFDEFCKKAKEFPDLAELAELMDSLNGRRIDAIDMKTPMNQLKALQIGKFFVSFRRCCISFMQNDQSP